ncbi:MAG: hypothetical protein GF365_02285 [Candidatus Buchananbacteria bacterium]|nr:hypothetical protein [Candidatus Buchananbacteria bacterium]
MELTVYCLTHGKTKEHGDTPKTYDADLTEETVKQLKQLEIPEHDLVVCGEMARHKQTAKAVGVYPDTNSPWVGNDHVMFGLMENNDWVSYIWDFFQTLIRRYEGNSILVITSRYLPVLLQYCQNGGQAKYGLFKDFSVRIENNETIDGISMPPSGAIIKVTIDAT